MVVSDSTVEHVVYASRGRLMRQTGSEQSSAVTLIVLQHTAKYSTETQTKRNATQKGLYVTHCFNLL